jgi:hypothetical protein
MSALLAGGHSQLFGSQAPGLAQAWHRAVLDEERQERTPAPFGPRWRERLVQPAVTVALALTCAVPGLLALASRAGAAPAVLASPAALPSAA